MISVFLFSPDNAPLTAAPSPDIVHVSCIPYLCGKKLPEKGKFPGGGKKVLVSFPFISRGKAYSLFCGRFKEFASSFDGFTLQNPGDHETLCELLASNPSVKREELFIAGDAALNVSNNATARFWQGRLDSAAILPELSDEEQLELADRFPDGLLPEIITPANKIVMRSEHCFAVKGKAFHCGQCGRYGLEGGSLFDINGKKFPVATNPIDCNSVLLVPGSSQAFGPAEFSPYPERLILRVF
ncbi:MAG: hypothetical protein K6G89_04070 [Clostridia bacterium]|nr:hypothetical protein [Clostridia bacterium]